MKNTKKKSKIFYKLTIIFKTEMKFFSYFYIFQKPKEENIIYTYITNQYIFNNRFL